MKLFYCPICGTRYLFYGNRCDKCNNQIELVVTKHDWSYYKEKSNELYGDDKHDDAILLEEEIHHNPLYNSDDLEKIEKEYAERKAHEKYMNDLRAKINENLKREEEEKHHRNNDPRCPTCGSYNVKRISGMKRAVHGYAFGIFSKTAFSQFECSSCGYKW